MGERLVYFLALLPKIPDKTKLAVKLIKQFALELVKFPINTLKTQLILT